MSLGETRDPGVSLVDERVTGVPSLLKASLQSAGVPLGPLRVNVEPAPSPRDTRLVRYHGDGGGESAERGGAT